MGAHAESLLSLIRSALVHSVHVDVYTGSVVRTFLGLKGESWTGKCGGFQEVAWQMWNILSAPALWSGARRGDIKVSSADDLSS